VPKNTENDLHALI